MTMIAYCEVCKGRTYTLFRYRNIVNSSNQTY
uniref:Rich Immunoreceptor tyrosine-based activation motif n=1 Tax=Siphoviridae sp. ctr2f5 TaxID=2825684 RepID=A0A8S5QEJ1_9CAUD|nr:MAG TPA: rich Immunoreceptor tyrosine-based activation motif [Siphoviridae sp. ctr2f5]